MSSVRADVACRSSEPARQRLFRGLAALLCCLALNVPAAAQKDTGRIVGTVKDASGAVVPEARVTVTEVAKGISFRTGTSGSGEYVISPLSIGQYEVKVEKAGFKTAIVGPLELQVQQRMEVDVTLEVGQVAQQVEVRQAAQLLETQTSELGQVVGSRNMVTFPLNGRNFSQLALLSSGVAPAEPGARNAGSFGFSSNGGRSYQNNFLLDGIDNNSNLTDLLNGTSYVVQPSVDALQEFKLQTNAYTAEFGRGNGAILNATVKSGTNEFHGDVYEFLRNDKLDARNFFDAARAPYQQNQFGFTIGGPIRLGRLYDGRNRTFFFFDYEGLRIRRGETLTATVPTAAERAGDFSELLDLTSPAGVLDCNGQPTYSGEIFDVRNAQENAASPTGVCGLPFGYDASGNPGNIIPAGADDSLATNLIKLWPLPNVSGAGFNFLANPKRITDRNNFDVRVDHKVGDKDTSFVRLGYEKQPSIIPAVFQSTGGNGNDFFTGDEVNFYLSGALSETHIFNPRLVNEFRFGYNRVNSHRYQFNFNKDVSGELGIPGVPFVPLNGGMPEFDFDDVDAIGDPTFLPSLEIQNTFVYSDNLTWVRDKHSFKFGGEIRNEEFTILQPASPRGNLGFDAVFTDNAGAPGTGGTGFASFLVGLPDWGNITNIHNVDYVRPVYAFYAQDDYRVTQKLTLNLGIRYDLFIPVMEKYDAQGSFDLTKRVLLVPRGQKAQLTPYIASLVPISATAPRGLVPTDTNNFAPRFGFAYKMTDRWVFRGGYGVFYGGYETGPWSNPSPAFNPPFFVTEAYNTRCSDPSVNPAPGQLDCSIPGFSHFANGFPASSLTDPNTPQLLQLDPTLVSPYMQQWNVSTEYQLPSETLLQITYAGSKGTKLYTFFNGNQAAPTADPTIPYAVRRPIPYIDAEIDNFATNGLSTYHSLQARAERRFSHGLGFLTSYTWSHSLDLVSAANLGSENRSDARWGAVHPEWEHGNSDFDIRHRFVFGYIYELPFGRGKRFGGSAGKRLDQLVGGWQVSGITTLSTGTWYTPRDRNFSNSGGAQHPDLVGDPNGKPCVPGTVFNTCAFADPPLGSFGNAGRNIIKGPGLAVWDLSIFKNFRTSERTHLEFRSEFFNLPNHANFAKGSGPSLRLGSSRFGFFTAARDPRQIQFALKFYF